MTSSTDITQYCTVWSWYMRKRIDHWCSVVPVKSQPSGPTFHWETWRASFPTGTLGPRVGIFLSPLNTNDGFYLSHIIHMKDTLNLTLVKQKRSWSGMREMIGLILTALHCQICCQHPMISEP